jgi:triphosphoribosyl-dephospho-CoA synthase
MKAERSIAQLAQAACILEACAPKPGNVNRIHDFMDATLEDFLLSAVAIGPALQKAAHIGIGQIIWEAVVHTRQWVQSNTNLGLILLLAPLVKACSPAAKSPDGGRTPQNVVEGIRERLRILLNSLTIEDARLAYAAIRLARAGGLGSVSREDVSAEASVTLLQAMALAKDRDSIASEYATGFQITFETALPVLRQALSQKTDLSHRKYISDAIVQAFLTVLSRVPDTLIARKRGLEAARRVSRMARDVLDRGGIFSSEGRAALEKMDRKLRDAGHALNPGTTSDLTAAAVFLVLIEQPDLYWNRQFIRSGAPVDQ